MKVAYMSFQLCRDESKNGSSMRVLSKLSILRVDGAILELRPNLDISAVKRKEITKTQSHSFVKITRLKISEDISFKDVIIT